MSDEEFEQGLVIGCLEEIADHLKTIAENTKPVKPIDPKEIQKNDIYEFVKLVSTILDNEHANTADKFRQLREYVNFGIQRLAQLEQELNS